MLEFVYLRYHIQLLLSYLQRTETEYVFVQEVHNTVCMSQELARRCLWLYRVCAPAGGQSQDPPSSGEIELRRRLEALHKDLKVG